MDLEDKRKFPRLEYRESLQYRFAESPDQNGTVGYDLSEGGVRFRAEEFLPLDAIIVLNLQLKPEREATMSARVVWAQKIPHAENYHIGCEFLENRENVFPRFVLKSHLEWLQA